ncbi:death-associated inhibitor of apoptosis 1 [Chelonus insularis]|uniref:death-associated inhibitor of apoptosis 1 n=1 Tax=Chelonus insularis TaxID=460826 RepID=UPI00158F6258|nr:death-associated inhibitor of apoptosis 1 [Chelonus insularis]XP_034949213.1 death-associated inhibitor of apoptosis 1 [Chelonus insularis]XP_034949214.1 death-associated inhibitor of apoptosis 1 [Chelonus insularis]
MKLGSSFEFKMNDCIDRKTILKDNLTCLKPTENSQSQFHHNQHLQPSDQIDEVDNQTHSPNYRYESVRLQSFTNWPVPYMDPAKLAASGFYFTGEGDYVKCFECDIKIGQWVEGDNPMSDHQRWQSNCRFVKRLPCGNVPIDANVSVDEPASSRSRDVCGHYDDDFRPNAVPDFRIGDGKMQSNPVELGSLGIAHPKCPVHPAYASYDARLRTFESWPKSMLQTKEQLADAGFYYTGTGDQTLCYHCGGGLKDWEPTDDPWVQHAKWFKKCYYVLMVKGQSFINSVIGQPITLPSREETMKMNLPSYIEKVESPPPSVEIESVATEAKREINVKATPKKASSDDGRMCKICYNEELGVVFLPCRHMVACTKCAPSMTTCAVCREPVTMTVRAIIS